MKKSFLKTGAVVALLLGTMQAADFNYDAYGGFVQGTQRGAGGGTVSDIHWHDSVLMPDGNTTYEMVDWGLGGASRLELIPENGQIASNGVQKSLWVPWYTTMSRSPGHRLKKLGSPGT
ncbi:MAG: hypothetical protein IE918_05380 [Campylobacterales bacterium]|nr:hypothetical protein [Campylobacterales bacterium]